jgi:hypothetical protein
MKRLCLLLLLLLILPYQSCSKASAKGINLSPGNVTVEAIIAPGDTARYIVRWSPPTVGPNQFPISGYLVRLIHASVDTFVFHNTVLLLDTIATPRPLTLVDSIGPMNVIVVAVDTRSQKSAPATTGTWWIKRKALPPNPPGPPVVDSSLSILIMDVRPVIVAASAGTKFQLCPFVVASDGAKHMLTSSPGTGTDGKTVITNYDTIPYCLDKFQLYLAEKPA